MATHRAENNTKKSNTKLYQKTIGALACVSLLAVGGVATISSFTDTGAATITSTAGEIELLLGATGTVKTATLALGSTLVPGATIPPQSLVIRNPGTIIMKYSGAISGTPGPLAAAMNVTVTDGATAVYTGKANTIAIPERALAAKGTHTLVFTYTWADGGAGADNSLMGASGATTLAINAKN